MTGRVRVAVTGMGLRTPAGGHPKELWNALLSGRSTARRITSFDTRGLACDFACEVGELDVGGYLTPREADRLDRVAQLAVCAADDALADAFDGACDGGRGGGSGGAGGVRVPPERRAVVAGICFGGMRTLEAGVLGGARTQDAASLGEPRTPDAGTLGKSRTPGAGVAGGARPTAPGPLYVPMVMHNAAAAAISIRHQIKGHSLTIGTACASGSNAIGEGARLLRDGSADLVIAGGSESCLTPTVLLAFDRCGALSRRTAAPERASRPFDRDRDGFVLAEGAAFLVLENLEHALRRGARVHAELTGYGSCSDAHHLTAPAAQGEGAYRCMRAALADAGLEPGEIAHVNAHGSGTRLNDLGEAQAISRLFGPAGVPVTGTKGVTGHAIAAAGVIEAVAAILAMRELTLPPTANLENLDPECPIDVAREARPLPPGPVMSNSFGFGGHNATLIFAPI
ncbi:beta-ketoacyl-[acyl-carrier-protein] synthase family protein [Nonomuraea candida]|uniref:beta-ketoacyl-[acyl-carrier-protein] synthase family protein n=1 Tax=Nonomuraea candida TaxID=359159 RepID=UPI0005BD44D7|nr:beta-ketoacyl-[acyl-carrier-protein] synthase family protein [Nonomuraea candida]